MRRRRFTGVIIALVAMVGLTMIPSASADRDSSGSQGAADKPTAASTVVRQGTAAGPGNDCSGFSASSPQTRVVTDDFARLNYNTFWTSLPCGATSVTVPRGRSALVVANVNAEVSCRGPAGQWCLGRVLIGGVEGEPNAPEPDSFAWATARPNLEQWESNAFTRTRTVTCPISSPTVSCGFSVITQVRNHTTDMIMRVDDRTLEVRVSF